MKKKTKVMIGILIVIAFIAVGFAIWWFRPTYFLNGVKPTEIAAIEVFNGNDGNRFDITDAENIKVIAESIQTVPMNKDCISMGMGTTYNLRFLNSKGNEIDKFIIMSPTTIRRGMVFYECNGELQQVEDHLIELEGAQFPDTDWIKNQG